jgi:hypothetical protein
MKLKEIKKRVKIIKETCNIPEVAHEEEDFLYYDFVNAIRKGKYQSLEEVVKAAKAVNKARKVKFARWRS